MLGFTSADIVNYQPKEIARVVQTRKRSHEGNIQ